MIRTSYASVSTSADNKVMLECIEFFWFQHTLYYKHYTNITQMMLCYKEWCHTLTTLHKYQLCIMGFHNSLQGILIHVVNYNFGIIGDRGQQTRTKTNQINPYYTCTHT